MLIILVNKIRVKLNAKSEIYELICNLLEKTVPTDFRERLNRKVASEGRREKMHDDNVRDQPRL